MAAAVITLPMSVGYGTLAFAALGPDFAGLAALLGILSAVVGGFFAALAGSCPVQISGPKAPLTLTLAGLVAALAASPAIPSGPGGTLIILCAAALSVATGGILLLLQGALRMGVAAKYVPYPVVAGFMNGIGCILMYKQVRPLLGIAPGGGLYTLLPGACAVGGVTIAVALISKRVGARLPASLSGLLAGTLLHHLLVMMLGAGSVGREVGAISLKFPLPGGFLQAAQTMRAVDVQLLLPLVLGTGLVLGLLGSLESLLNAVAVDNVTGQRHDGSRELLGQGFGNLAAALFGALPSAGSAPRALANYKAGGRTRLSGMVAAVLMLLITLAGAPLIARIPVAAIAGLIAWVGWGMLDRWSIKTLTEQLRGRARSSRDLMLNLSVTALVTLITLLFNLLAAVGAGIVLSIILFLSRVSRGILRQRLTGVTCRSRKQRPDHQEEVLDAQGHRLMVYKLQGPLFFGSADALATAIEESMAADMHLLDLSRINEMDATGCKLLLLTARRLQERGKLQLLAHTSLHPGGMALLRAMDEGGVISGEHCFDDTDAALEWAEERLLSSAGVDRDPGQELSVDQLELTRGFSAGENERFSRYLERREVEEGRPIIREGEPGDRMYMLARGLASVRAGVEGGSRVRRFISYPAGASFGEMALLDGSPRSVDVWPDCPCVVHCLTVEALTRMEQEHPDLAVKLLTNLALGLSGRMRSLTREVRARED